MEFPDCIVLAVIVAAMSLIELNGIALRLVPVLRLLLAVSHVLSASAAAAACPDAAFHPLAPHCV